MRRFFILFILLFMFFSCAATIHLPVIVKRNYYGSFDISFKWKYENNTFKLTGSNNFWTEIFYLEIAVTPVDKNMNPIDKSHKKYIGSLDTDEKFVFIDKFKVDNIQYFQVDYSYTYAGYNSSGSRLNYYTLYFKLK